MSDEFPVELPSEKDLKQLPLASVATYAIRCALRVQPFLSTWKEATKVYKQAIIRLNNLFKIQIKNTINTEGVEYTNPATTAQGEDPRPYSAFNATSSALFAYFDNHSNNDDRYFFDTVLAVESATEAVDASGNDEEDVAAAARADYSRLIELKTEVTDASETGPLGDLWLGSPPDWYICAKEHYDKTIAEWEREITGEDPLPK